MVLTSFRVRMLTLLVAALAILGVTPAATPPVYADADGCSLSSPTTSVNCIAVRSRGGSGAFITHVEVGRAKGDPDTVVGTICNFHMEVIVRSSGGYELAHWRGPTYNGCVLREAAQEWQPNTAFPDGARICGYVYEGGALTPGHPCETVLDKGAPACRADAQPVTMTAADPAACAVLKALAGSYACGTIVINSQGDVYVNGETQYDCPPYDGWQPAKPVERLR